MRGTHRSLCCTCFSPTQVPAYAQVPYTPESVAAFIAREHEFRFLAVEAANLDGTPNERLAVRGR